MIILWMCRVTVLPQTRPESFRETNRQKTGDSPMKTLSAVGLGILLLLMESVWAAAGVPGDQVRQTTDKLLAILEDPQLKGESKKSERRHKLKEVLYKRFDFTEMAKRALGSEWRRRSPEEQRNSSNFLPICLRELSGQNRILQWRELPILKGARRRQKLRAGRHKDR